MNPDVAAGQPPPKHGIARRSVLRSLGAGALATGAGGVLAACTADTKGTQPSATSTITLGYISPFSGSLAGFASGDGFVSLNKAVKIGANLEPTKPR
jgi:branched-chain amino acid transport system substrate-binding protein